jgi:selT/selW/selH-like putative selenoprotein
VADELKKEFGVEADLIAGSDGIFDVKLDDRLIYSKTETGRFPEPGEIVGKLK